MHLRILSWNIHKGIGSVDRRYRLERIAEVLKSQTPDIALLQEVADGWSGAGHDHQAPLLAKELGFEHYAFGPEHRFATGGYGNAILSRFPLHEVHHLDLTVSWRKKRGALLAKAVVRQEGHQHTVALCNMHLGLAGTERGTQLTRFFNCEPFRGIHHDTLTIVGGDLNDLYGSLGPKHLEPQGFRRIGPLAATFPAFLPMRPLDGLFVRGTVKSSGHAVKTQVATRASDHLPIIGILAP